MSPEIQDLYGPPAVEVSSILPKISFYIILPVIILVGLVLYFKKKGRKENKQGKKIEKK